jgi:hypothetical protein
VDLLGMKDRHFVDPFIPFLDRDKVAARSHGGGVKVVRIYLNDEVMNPASGTLKIKCRELVIDGDVVKVETEFPDPFARPAGDGKCKFYVEVDERNEAEANDVLMSLGWLGEKSTPDGVIVEEGDLPVTDEMPESEPDQPTPIQILGLAGRIEKVLEDGGVVSIEQLAGMSVEELCEIKGIGKKTAGDLIAEVKTFLGEDG